MTFFAIRFTRFTKLSIFVFFLVGIFPAYARIGERQANASGRYGKGNKLNRTILPGATTYKYTHEKWTIKQAYVKDIAYRVIYSSPYGNISEKELQAIFSAEAGCKYWSELSKANKSYYKIPSDKKAWTSGKGHIAIQVDNNTLRIDSKKVRKYLIDYEKNKSKIRNNNTPDF